MDYLLNNINLNKEELIEELEQYYEAAGFKNPRGRELGKLTVLDLKKLYLMDVYEEKEDIPF